MNTEWKLLDAVALLRDIPEKSLNRGQLGVIVEILADDVFEVEFADRNGRTIALLPLQEKDLLQLHTEPLAIR